MLRPSASGHEALWPNEQCIIIWMIQMITANIFLAVKVSNNSTEVRSRVTVQSVQLLPEQGFRENESYITMSLDPGTDEETLVPVEVSSWSAQGG